MAKEKVTLEIDGDSSGAENAVGAVGAKTIALGNLMSDAVKLGVEALTKSLVALGTQLISAANQAAEAQRGQILFAQTMATAGTYTKEAFKASVDYASALQMQTAFEDDAILAAQKSFAVYGFQGKQLQDLTKATLDLATAKGMDLQSAADLVAKSVGTETNAMKRMGIELDDTKDKSARAESAIRNLGNLFGGAANADAKTFTGAIANLKNIWGDLYETLGDAIINNKAIQVVFTEVRKVLLQLTGAVDTNKNAIANYIKDGIIILINTIVFLLNTIDVLQRGWNDLGNLFLWVNKIILQAAQFLVNLSATINDVFTTIIGLASKVIPGMDGIKKSFELAGKGAKETSKDIQYMIDATNEEMAAGNKAADARSTTVQKIVTAVEQIGKKVGEIKDAYTPTTEIIDNLITQSADLVDTKALETQALIDIAKGYTAAELAEYQTRAAAMQQLVLTNQITQEQYAAWIEANGKKFNDAEYKRQAERTKMTSDAYAMILSISKTQSEAVLAGQKTIGNAMSDAAKAAARNVIDAEVDKAIASIGIIEALETAKATLGGFLSFGATLLAIPLIAAAATAAKALIHGIVGFAEGGIVGAGGARIPLPGAGSAASGPASLIMAHAGEVVGTPARLAAAGIGGVNLIFNNYGTIGSDDAEDIGRRMGEAAANALKGAI